MHTLNLRSFLWFTTGVALTITTIATFGAWRADAAVTTGESTFVPVTPCRLFDTRPGTDNVGTRSTPIAQTNVTMQVTGTNGGCTIPTDATAVAMNVTIVNPSASSFLQAFPSDVTRPSKGSNLNFTAGQAPVPNKVDVKLGATGAIKLFNNAGTVDALADIVGYYKSSTITQLSADVAALQATVTQLTAANTVQDATIAQNAADTKSLLDDTNVIPSGVTVSGYQTWDFESVRDNADVYFTVQLPGNAPAPFNVSVAPDLLTFDPDISCTGSIANPTAPAGKVCIYVSASEGAADVSGQNAPALGLTAFNVFFNINDATPSTDAFLDITWAYTAP